MIVFIFFKKTERIISTGIFRTSYDQPIFVKNDKIYYGRPDKSSPNSWVQAARSNVQLDVFFLHDDDVHAVSSSLPKEPNIVSKIKTIITSPPPKEWIPGKKKKYVRYKQPSRDKRKRSRLPKRVK